MKLVLTFKLILTACHFLMFLLTGIDLIAAFYGCLYAGCIPVTVRPPHPQNLAATLPTVRMIIDVSYTHTMLARILQSLILFVCKITCMFSVGEQSSLYPDHPGSYEDFTI